MNDIKRRRDQIAAAKAAAQEPEPGDGPSPSVIAAGFVFVALLIGLALYFIHALTATPGPILPPH